MTLLCFVPVCYLSSIIYFNYYYIILQFILLTRFNAHLMQNQHLPVFPSMNVGLVRLNSLQTANQCQLIYKIKLATIKTES